MTKREQQYINWKTYWRKRKPPVITEEIINGIKFYKSVHSPGHIRVPDSMLKKMGLWKKESKPELNIFITNH